MLEWIENKHYQYWTENKRFYPDHHNGTYLCSYTFKNTKTGEKVEVDVEVVGSSLSWQYGKKIHEYGSCPLGLLSVNNTSHFYSFLWQCAARHIDWSSIKLQ